MMLCYDLSAPAILFSLSQVKRDIYSAFRFEVAFYLLCIQIRKLLNFQWQIQTKTKGL